MGGQLDSKIGEVGGQLHRELGKLVVGRGVKMAKVGAGGRGEVVRNIDFKNRPLIYMADPEVILWTSVKGLV